MAPVIIAAAQREMLLDPDDLTAVCEARRLEIGRDRRCR
jgi:hypothetical protein